MIIITNPKLKQHALEDIAELHTSRPLIKDETTNTMYFMKWYTQKYIMKKFDLSKEDVEEYLHESE